MKKLFFLLLISLFTLSACDQSEKPLINTVIGLSLPNGYTEYTRSMINQMYIEAKSNNYTLIVVDAGGKVETQATQIKSLAFVGIKSLMIVPPKDPSILSSLLDSLHTTLHIPIISLIEPYSIASNSIKSTIQIDYSGAGSMAAQLINKTLTDGEKYRIFYLRNILSSTAIDSLRKGFDRNISQSLEASGGPMGAMNNDMALLNARSIVKNNKACIAFDELVLSALFSAMQEESKTLDDFKIFVISGSPKAKEYLSQGIISGIIYQSPEKMALTAFETCTTCINGQLQESTIELQNEILLNEKNK